MRLIDVDALCDEIESVDYFGKDPEVERICGLIQKAKWIDAVPVIRCKDCKFLRFTGTVWKCQNRLVMMLCESNDYCSRAERKEE